MNKVILITGASSGIGRAAAELLAKHGHRVFGTTRSASTARAIEGAELLSLDVRDEASAANCVQEVLRRADRIDVLVNNAGYSLFGTVEETSPEEAQALFDTNVFGVLRMIRAALPAMRAQRSGLIVNVSSVLGFLPAPFMGLYAATKHALEGLSESLDHEVRGFGVRVVLVEPNFTRTQFGAHTVRSAQRISDYGAASEQAAAALEKNLGGAPAASIVAFEIARAIERPHRMRRPGDRSARMLSRLRRFMPAAPVDRSIRRVFGFRDV